MTLAKRFASGLLYFVALSTLLLGSCVGPMVVYSQSPRWLLEEVGASLPTTFFVAFRTKGDDGALQLRVERYDPAKKRPADAQYHLPDGRLTYSSGPGEGDASIEVATEKAGSQLVRVFVTGDTPWTSLSEYRVADNTVQPLRHAHSAGWLLLGIIVCLLLVKPLMKPTRRGIARLLQLEPGQTGERSP